jgi:hypothetical protein
VDRASGVVHVVYPGMDDPEDDGYVVHAERSVAGTWTCDRVASDWQNAFVGGIGVSLDATGNPSIVYRRSNGLSTELSVEIARRSGATWSTKPMGFADGGAGIDESVAIGHDRNGMPFIAYDLREANASSVRSAFVATASAPAQVLRHPKTTAQKPLTEPLAAGALGLADHIVFRSDPKGQTAATELDDAVATGTGLHTDHVKSSVTWAAATFDPTGHMHAVACKNAGPAFHFLR